MAIWAITAYFNPAGFRRRYANYRVFRKALGLPLLAVEWSPDGRFELTESDAERVIRVSGGDLMWQKERLLNIAIAGLPADCEEVAWLDCDVVFSDTRWIADTLGALQQAVVVQLFTKVVHLPAAVAELASPEVLPREPALLVRDSLASRIKEPRRRAMPMPAMPASRAMGH